MFRLYVLSMVSWLNDCTNNGLLWQSYHRQALRMSETDADLAIVNMQIFWNKVEHIGRRRSTERWVRFVQPNKISILSTMGDIYFSSLLSSWSNIILYLCSNESLIKLARHHQLARWICLTKIYLYTYF